MSHAVPLVEPKCSPDEWNQLCRTSAEHYGLPLWQEIRRHNLTIFYRQDLGDDLSEAKKAILSLAVSMQVQVELADNRMLKGQPLPEDYTKLGTTFLRLLKELGLERKAKGAANNLAMYLAGKAGNDVAASLVPAWMAEAAG